ncbi:phosphoribosylaminoimidazolesuccinocarboxamide synthase [Tuberibacillus calidus]|jgi:phosphoribosylaminoimidazole-succinocarboxamide synthase|uniref:phosphoribosylaminoimidazolesuccinocarboxamide synthase n=1 Tax=Tuberibacillus calidus TaxID=340097 RepID=UPI00042857DF|nr:phosphoribosylaminoimidazolesuccinocarboxamide synthase [Tuberibacillus calidus]
MELLYEGKAKRVYRTENEYVLLVKYKDEATAFNAQKKAVIEGKGRLNNEISTILFTMLKKAGVDTHFIEKVSETEQLVRAVDIIPLEVIVRNVAAGSLSQRLGLQEGRPLKQPVIEFCYKRDDLGDPLITEAHIDLLELATPEEVALIKQSALKINDILSNYFDHLGILLVDFKLEFGREKASGKVILADEISPDTCRLWDKATGEKLDKDVFRKDLGDLQTAYAKILERLI